MVVPAPIRSRRVLAGLLAVAGLALAVLLAWRALRPAAPPRVVILLPAADAGPVASGLPPLLSDVMEVLLGATVTQVAALPEPEELRHLPPATWFLRFQASRDGDRLDLTCDWSSAQGILQGRPWQRQRETAEAPLPRLQAWVHGWPFPTQHGSLEHLIPGAPGLFWRLLEGLAIRDDASAVAHLAESQRLVDDAPDCATAWVALGDHLYRSLWVQPDLAGIGLNSRTHRAFTRAVELVPGHPRGTFLWSMMLTDTGNQGLALRALQQAVHQRPAIPDLYLGVAYAGRTSGLLSLARKALDRRKALLGPLTTPSAWFAETTYLYLGDLEGFRKDLARADRTRPDAVILFYRGYFELLQGHNEQALAFMRAGSREGTEHAPFRDLCGAYTAYLEGHPSGGLALLDEVDRTRGRLRIPDGEWTFKEAEAYALLGNADRGVDCATRAFGQGFSCAAWYERAPFLARVRQHPRWPMLLRNVRERQAVLEATFPPSAF